RRTSASAFRRNDPTYATEAVWLFAALTKSRQHGTALQRAATVRDMPKRHSDQLTGLTVGGGFVGRERELDRIGVLLRGPARLVTLIGSGGIGKTRLADEAARRLHRARGTPVWCVRLARLPADADAS